MADKSALVEYCDQKFAGMLTERYSFWTHWHELGSYILPRRYKWLITPNQMNRGSPINGKIIDNTGTIAARTCASGMMAGVTSPTRPWFRLAIGKQSSDGNTPVNLWLYQVERLMMKVFQESNFYNAMAVLYHDLVVFGSAAMIIYEDFDNVIHCYNPAVGEFLFGNSPKLQVDQLYREFVRNVGQLVDEFGLDNVSETVRGLYTDCTGAARTREVVVRHAIEPNSGKWKEVPKHFKFIEVYWERGQCEKPLRVKGFHEWPALCPRWDITANDAYGRSPGMDALNDIKQLQQEQVRKSQAIDKMVNPPLVGDIQLQNQPASTLPGAITYVAGINNVGLKPIYTVNPPVQEIMLDIKEVQERIKSTFFTDLFMMISQLQTVRSAAEIDARREERLVMLGPVLERIENEGLAVAIERVFGILARGNLLPPAPPELHGQNIEVNFVSMLAEAQKAAQTSGMERLAATVGNLAGATPDVLDKLDMDEFVDEYSAALGNSPKLIRDQKTVQKLREARAQAQQQQQLLEQTVGGAKAAKTLSETDVGGGQSALSRMLGA